MKERCLVIPAIKKNAIIPDQLVKKLAGETLIVRALNTARAVCQGEDIIVLTDSQEISLICERAGVRFRKNQALRFSSKDILHEMRELLLELAQSYRYCIVYRASCPLVTWVDIEEAWKSFLKNGAKSLITVKKVHQRVLNLHQGNLEYLLEDKERPLVVETKAFIMVDLAYFAKGN
ncbi:MAG: cytidine 5'-phosphate N-acetylneuraminic acid synthetase, partial [Desulfovibrio sp.]|nr:cytidine 5'-phosphate N-acetylneuraminic acid synthetase [Desulfovibrio sp.]